MLRSHTFIRLATCACRRHSLLVCRRRLPRLPILKGTLARVLSSLWKARGSKPPGTLASPQFAKPGAENKPTKLGECSMNKAGVKVLSGRSESIEEQSYVECSASACFSSGHVGRIDFLDKHGIPLGWHTKLFSHSWFLD